jgi:hypothetical protein
MMQHLSQDQIVAMAMPIPMSRDDKLERWASLIENSREPVFSFHGLEYQSQYALDQLAHPRSAFAIAAGDPLLKEAGLTTNKVGDGMRFFDLSMEDVHALTCDCLGPISNRRMANRIRRLNSPPRTSVFGRLFSWFGRR